MYVCIIIIDFYLNRCESNLNIVHIWYGQYVNIWYNMLMMKSADLLFVNTDHMLLFISVVLTPMFVTWQNDRILQLSPMANFFYSLMIFFLNSPIICINQSLI